MAKEKNFTLRIDARLLDEFLTACRKQDRVASGVVRESMRYFVRLWRKEVNNRYDPDTQDDDLVPGYDDHADGAALRAEAAEARHKRKLDAERQAKLKAETDASLEKLRKQTPSPSDR